MPKRNAVAVLPGFDAELQSDAGMLLVPAG